MRDRYGGPVFYLAIHPDYQGSGYGKHLMSHIESLLIALGCPKLNIVVRSTNESVLEFYDKLSYQPDDVITLAKRLIADS
ncbi:MAG: GNAT family N-acetyltransferase [Haliea sp.]|nr:GNAT family N-acetyltransferase [Haliea sp.]